MMKELVFAQAQMLAGDLDAQQRALLKVLCSAATASLASRLRAGITAEHCREEFIMAASLYALADLRSAQENGQVEEFKAGDLTVKQGSTQNRDAVSRCLQRQAELLIAPYLKDRFAFQGV